MAAEGGHVSTIQYMAPKMESLHHSTDNDGFTMLHVAAQNGLAEVVQLAIDEYKLDPTAHTKVCLVRHTGVLQWAVGPVVGCAM